MTEAKRGSHERCVAQHQKPNHCETDDAKLRGKIDRTIEDERRVLLTVRHGPAEVRSRTRTEDGVRIEDISSGVRLCLAIEVAPIGGRTRILEDRDALAYEGR